jgi:hypothetical protein
LGKNYGTLIEPWIELLLKKDKSRVIKKRVEWFVRTNADPSNAVTIRIATKIGLLYAAGYIAQRAGLLPWPAARPKEVARFIYAEISRRLIARDHSLDDLIEKLHRAIDDPARFLSRAGKGDYVILGPGAIGLRITSRQRERWLLHPAGLTNLGVPAHRCGDTCQRLLQRGIIIRTGKKSGTVQERVVDGNERVKKIRFWVLDVSKVRDAGTNLKEDKSRQRSPKPG